jgi:hypothetical protein
MSERYWERDKRLTKEYVHRQLVANYIEEFGLTKPTRKKAKFIVAQGV